MESTILYSSVESTSAQLPPQKLRNHCMMTPPGGSTPGGADEMLRTKLHTEGIIATRKLPTQPWIDDSSITTLPVRVATYHSRP